MIQPTAGVGPGAGNLFQRLRETRRDIAAAGDQQMLQVLRMMETLDQRGAADALLAPVRARLSVLRPARPLRFARLLFLPVDALIVDTKTWDTSHPLVPRAALAPLAALVCAQLGPIAAEISATVRHADTTDEPLVARMGALLWPGAADVLATAHMPQAWGDTGFKHASFIAISRGLAGVLAVAQDLAAADAPPDLLPLARAAMASPHGFAMLLTLLLVQFPGEPAPSRAISLARAAAPGIQDAARRAIEAALARLTGGAQHQNGPISADTAANLRRDITLLDVLQADPLSARRATALRSDLSRQCAARFVTGITENLAQPLAAIARAGTVDDTALADLENAARALRAFETEARSLGGPDTYDRGLAATAANAIANHVLCPMERARLVEILAGPEAAYKMLSQP